MSHSLKPILSVAYEFDIRAETLATALLMEAQQKGIALNLDQLVLQPSETLQRRHKHDVVDIRTKLYNYDYEALLMRISRKGLFDSLPIGLFVNRRRQYDDPVERSKDIEAQIKSARQFFLPYEQSLYISRIEVEKQELKLSQVFPEFVYDIWGLRKYSDCINDHQMFLLSHLLPHAYRTVGDWSLTAQCIELLVNKPVDIDFRAPQMLSLEGPQPSMEDTFLGRDAVLGDTFRDEMPLLEIQISEIAQHEIEGFLPEGKYDRMLNDLLYNYFIPLDVPFDSVMLVEDKAYDVPVDEIYMGYNFMLHTSEISC